MRPVMAFGGAALLAMASVGVALADSGHVAAPGPAQLAATALANAASADKSGNRKELMRALAMLDGLGVHALDGSQADPLATWQRSIHRHQPVYRGRPLGPGYRSGKLAPGGAESFSQLFLSGEGATIALSSPTGNRVTMKVADPQAQTICSGEARRDGSCHWVPIFTQRYTIEVTNPGVKDAQYFLVVN
jgi:hypothetical protein